MSSFIRDRKSADSEPELSQGEVASDGYDGDNYDIHMHSAISDGPVIFHMARAAKSAGMDMIAITDHENYEFVEDDLEGYIEVIEDANEDTEGIEIVAGLEINYETDKNDRYEIEKKLAEEGLSEHPEPDERFREKSIEQEKRDKASKDSIKVPYASVHDVDGTYVKRENDFLEKLYEDYLEDDWASIDDIEEVDRGKILEINEKIDVIKEAYADIYTDKIERLAEEGEPFKFMAHPDLILRNSVLKKKMTEGHLDRIINSVKNSSMIPEANGKGVMRQFRGDIENVIDNRQKSPEDEISEFRKIINESQDMAYFRKIGEENIDYVTGSDSHRAGEIELRDFYFQLLAKSLDKQPLTLEEIKKHIE